MLLSMFMKSEGSRFIHTLTSGQATHKLLDQHLHLQLVKTVLRLLSSVQHRADSDHE